MRNRVRNALCLCAGWALTVAIAGTSPASYAQNQNQDQQERQQPRVRDIDIWQMIIRDSIASYAHACPCPYSENRAGRTCGTRSAYSRVRGSVTCFPNDISDAAVSRYRERLQ